MGNLLRGFKIIDVRDAKYIKIYKFRYGFLNGIEYSFHLLNQIVYEIYFENRNFFYRGNDELKYNF